MIMVEMRHGEIRKEPLAVGNRRYFVDAEGTVNVQPEDVETLTVCGFMAVGQVELPEKVVRLPASKKEFLDVAKNLKLTPLDLRELAAILEEEEIAKSAPPEIEVQDLSDPESGLEMFAGDPQMDAPEEEMGPLPEEEAPEEIKISMSMSREELLAIADRMDVPVKDRRKKQSIYYAIVNYEG